MERKKILVAFGDILGFAPWIQRAMTEPEESRDLIEEVYEEFERISIEMGCYVKFLGDGIMLIKELGDQKDIAPPVNVVSEFLKNAYILSTNTGRIIKKHFPRPDGFRIRVGVGYVWKRNTTKILLSRHSKCPKDISDRCTFFSGENAPEYIGYIINLTQRLTKVASRISCICHESVKEVFGKNKSQIKFKRITKPSDHPRGVDLEDLENLWSFSVVENEQNEK